MACSNGSFQLESPAFADGGVIPALHSGDGLDLSPPLRWRGSPRGCGSLALVMDDPDAAAGPWLHWLLFNIPPTLQRLHGVRPAQGDGRPCAGHNSPHGPLWPEPRSSD